MDRLTLLYSKAEIADCVDELAEAISRDYADKELFIVGSDPLLSSALVWNVRFRPRAPRRGKGDDIDDHSNLPYRCNSCSQRVICCLPN